MPEALLMAGMSHMRVISVDYRMPPTAYFPAALDDAMTVYKAELKTTNPKDIGVFGRSAGGALTLEMMLSAKQEHLPMPGAIGVNTPMADLVDQGDSSRTNAWSTTCWCRHRRTRCAPPRPFSMPMAIAWPTRCSRRSMATSTAFRRPSWRPARAT